MGRGILFCVLNFRCRLSVSRFAPFVLSATHLLPLPFESGENALCQSSPLCLLADTLGFCPRARTSRCCHKGHHARLVQESDIEQQTYGPPGS